VTLPTAQPPAAPWFDYARQRVSYDRSGLTEEQLAPDPAAPTPLAQFERWYADAVAAGLPEPNAMVLSTVDADGGPTSRTVLLKGADSRGMTFYTNYSSRKGRQLASVARVSLLFGWHAMARQVAVRGTAERLPAAETAQYFAQRPYGSRIGAWASHQSEPIDSRNQLEARWQELSDRWPDRGRPDDVPVPGHWGGYLVRPVEVEFWAGRSSRLHDRLVFESVARQGFPAMDDATGWRVLRRQP
jgi:pyridoxamine 5'-phosphate oxidase